MSGPSVTYANSEVRGQLRVWKQKLARDYAAFDSVYRPVAGDLRDAAVDLVKRSSRAGRERALAKIKRALGALLIGYYEKDALRFAGKVGTGFFAAEGRALLKRLKMRRQNVSVRGVAG